MAMMSKFEEFFLCQQAEAGKAIVDIAEYLLERCDRVKEMHQPTQVGEETVCAVCASFDPGGVFRVAWPCPTVLALSDSAEFPGHYNPGRRRKGK